MSSEEKNNFINSFDIVFSDIDGVIWNAMPSGAIAGVSEGIQFLESKGKKVIFVTNNSIRPIQEQIERFRENGISVKEEDVVHPAQTVVEYLKQIGFQGLVYCLASGPFKDHLRNAGYEVLEGVCLLEFELFILNR